MQIRFIEANGLRFEVLEEGSGNRLALCLHESMQNCGGVTLPLIELDHPWRTESPDSDGGRHPRASRSAQQYERRERAARSSCASASVVSCSCAWPRSR